MTTEATKTLGKLWEYGQVAISRAQKIKNDKNKKPHVRERAQAQADSWRAMMLLIREDGHKFDDTEYVLAGAITAPGAQKQMLCPDHREVMAFRDQNAEARRYECPDGCKWEEDWRGIWPEYARRTGLTPWTGEPVHEMADKVRNEEQRIAARWPPDEKASR